MKNRKVHNSNGPIHGCLGRMVNLFDINGGMAGNKRLMDKPHYDGSSRSRSRSVVPRSISPIGVPLEDKLIISEPRKNASDKTPMKMLIDHEMSKEDAPKQNPPSLVAKLMGLDTLPRQNIDSVLHRSQSNTQGTNTKPNFEKPQGNKDTNTSVSDKQWKCGADYLNQKDYNCIYELGKQAQGEKLVRDVSPRKGGHVKDIDERKMVLVRQKFSEAKRLVTDEKLRQTEAFQEALEFLSSHRDLFLKCLQEPNSQFSQQMYGNYTNSLIPDTQLITVLKPLMIEDDGKSSESENKNRKIARKSVPVVVAHGRSKSNDECSSKFSHWDAGHTAPTRIVVLKPSIVNAHGIGTMGSPNSSSLKTVNDTNFFNDSEVYDTNESREVAKEITRQMRDKLMDRQSDETLFSSVFSNGYTGDESSMNKSDNEYDGESDFEVMSPSSRHSWDYINRFRRPFSSLSFSRASCSPESSVCREAKKRLSERWAMVESHGNPPEQRHVRRSSCTLGEMLALSDAKKPYTSDNVGSEETNESMAYISHDLLDTDEILQGRLPNLLRSKSVPVSSSVYGDRLNVELSGPEVCKPEESREARSKSIKVSFKGKVSSLFFSKSKKVKKAASNVSEPENLPHDNTLGTSELRIGNNNCKTSKLIGKKVYDECIHIGDPGENGDMASCEDQPSPVSVLEMPFGESGTCAMELANCSRQEQDQQARRDQLKSCLIDKSPLIGSISRKNPYSDNGATFPITPSVAPLESESEEDWLIFVKTLLADSGISDEVRSDALCSIWHSPDSPLDPSLREKYINLNNNKSIASGANLRQWRSRCKLMYDCVNAALIDITRSLTPKPEDHNQIPLTDDIWSRIKEWINHDTNRSIADSPNRVLVDTAVKNEVIWKRWVGNIRVETDEVGDEIEQKLLEELVEDAVRCCVDR